MASQTETKEKPDKPEHKTITVIVFALNSTEGKSFTWKKTIRVHEAAAEAAAAFGVTDENATLAKDGTALDRDKSLAAAHVADGDRLELVGTGGGV